MSIRYSLIVGTLCVVGCLGRPNHEGGAGEMHENEAQGHGGEHDDHHDMMRHMMPPFLRNVSKEDAMEFMHIVSNMNISKGNIETNVQNWVNNQSLAVQEEYTAAKTSMTNKMNESMTALMANLTAAGETQAVALLTQVQGIQQNKDITIPDTCHQIVTVYNTTPIAAIEQLHEAVKTMIMSHMEGHGGLEGEEEHHEGMGEEGHHEHNGTMPGSAGGAGASVSGSASHPALTSAMIAEHMAEKCREMEFHDPHGHLDALASSHKNGHMEAGGSAAAGASASG